VATYGWMRDRDWSQSRWHWALRFIGGVALSSAIAGLATAPIAAAHFNQVPHFGLVANILSVPLMGAIVIPGAVLAAVLAPVGLDGIGLGLMAPAIAWILSVADHVAGMPGALSFVPAPQIAVLPLIALGGLWCVLWRGLARPAGVAAVAAGFLLWMQVDRPTVLISETGGLVGVMGRDGRVLSKPKGDGFAADSWLENDGDPVNQADAFERFTILPEGREKVFVLPDLTVIHATGKVAAKAALQNCENVDLVVVNTTADPNTFDLPETCRIIDKTRLSKTGSIAIFQTDAGIKIETARARQGARLWSQ